MADEETKRPLPYITSNVWAELRSRFQKTLPSRVTATYLQTALGFSSEKAARNLLPQLRAVGLIEGDGTPTALARRFRLDDDYAGVATDIVAAIYPDEMRELFPGPDVDVASVAPWIMRHTGGGQAGATTQARFYGLLVSGVLPESTGNGGARPATTRPPKEVSTSKVKAPKKKDDEDFADRLTAKNDASKRSGGAVPAPELHIDVQVHIDASASVEQIDAVFASMAKHIYKSD